MQIEEQLIAPHVEALAQNQYWITTALGEWYQSYETTIAFKGEFGVLINKDWYDKKRTATTSKWLGEWLSQVEDDADFLRGWKENIKSGKYKLISLSNCHDLERTKLWDMQATT